MFSCYRRIVVFVQVFLVKATGIIVPMYMLFWLTEVIHNTVINHKYYYQVKLHLRIRVIFLNKYFWHLLFPCFRILARIHWALAMKWVKMNKYTGMIMYRRKTVYWYKENRKERKNERKRNMFTFLNIEKMLHCNQLVSNRYGKWKATRNLKRGLEMQVN